MVSISLFGSPGKTLLRIYGYLNSPYYKIVSVMEKGGTVRDFD